jgi:hypothetical protein
MVNKKETFGSFKKSQQTKTQIFVFKPNLTCHKPDFIQLYKTATLYLKREGQNFSHLPYCTPQLFSPQCPISSYSAVLSGARALE